MQMKNPPTWCHRLASAALLLLLAACATPPPSPPSSPFEQDVIEATEGLVGQWRSNTPGRLRWPASPLALGPFIDLSAASSGQGSGFARPQTVAAAKTRQTVARYLETALPEFKLVPAESTATQADLLLSASLIPFVTPAGQPKESASTQPTLMLTLVLLDLKTSRIVARWQSPLRSQPTDANPTPFDAESPVLFNQTPTETDTRLFGAPVNTGIDADTIRGTIGLAQLNQAQEAYATGRYTKALALFQDVSKQSPALALRAANGEYLSYLKLGQPEAARQAFKRVVGAGIASRRLAVKLLFTPGETTFWADPEVSGAYGFWLQEISAQAAAAPACLEIAGHTSHTGEKAFNQGLSLARSERVRQIMQAAQPGLSGRLLASGKGWSENIVGSGSDAARDAIDRRVEFKIADCPAKR